MQYGPAQPQGESRLHPALLSASWSPLVGVVLVVVVVWWWKGGGGDCGGGGCGGCSCAGCRGCGVCIVGAVLGVYGDN